MHPESGFRLTETADFSCFAHCAAAAAAAVAAVAAAAAAAAAAAVTAGAVAAAVVVLVVGKETRASNATKIRIGCRK